MYIIFNSDRKVVGCCDCEPDSTDLASRFEFHILCEQEIHNPFDVIIGKYNTIFEPAPNNKTDGQLLTEKSDQLISYRNNKLRQTDWLVTRHLEQTMLNITQTLNDFEFNELLLYRQGLRDITLKPEFPNCHIPEFLI